MNPIKIEIILMRDFDFHGFSRYGEGRFTVLCRNILKFVVWERVYEGLMDSVHKNARIYMKNDDASMLWLRICDILGVASM